MIAIQTAVTGMKDAIYKEIQDKINEAVFSNAWSFIGNVCTKDGNLLLISFEKKKNAVGICLSTFGGDKMGGTTTDNQG